MNFKYLLLLGTALSFISNVYDLNVNAYFRACLTLRNYLMLTSC